MWSKPPEPSAIARIGVWKLRALGIFNIMASIYLFVEVVTPSAGQYIPFVIALMLTALIANFVLGIVWAHQTRNQKASREKLQ